MAAPGEKYIKLAQSLPPQLLRFFQRNQAHLADYFANAAKKVTPTATGTFAESSKHPNPFRSQKNLETGRWHDPIYSLRRQADLVKLARANGVEELLPPTVKGTEARIQKRAANGLRVKGTGYGQRVKGKLWERTMKGRLEKRRQAMEAMPTLIEEWKKVKISNSLWDLTALTIEIEGPWSWVEEVAEVGLYASGFGTRIRRVQDRIIPFKQGEFFPCKGRVGWIEFTQQAITGAFDAPFYSLLNL